jgi:transcription antitermination factor NusG
LGVPDDGSETPGPRSPPIRRRTIPAMPILPAEPEIYPPNLFQVITVPEDQPPGSSDGEAEGQDDLPRWWCLHAKPRQEKAAARFLRDRRLTHYLPQVVKESRTPGGRKIRSVIPLFPSYLFFRGNRRDRLVAFVGGKLVSILEVDDQERLQHDLEQIHRMLSSGLPVVPEPEFPIGSRVRIVDGPLRGLTGTIAKRGNRDLFVVVVHMLGQGASVDLEAWQVEAIED